MKVQQSTPRQRVTNLRKQGKIIEKLEHLLPMTFPYKLSHEVEDRRYNIQKSPNNRLQEALRSGE